MTLSDHGRYISRAPILNCRNRAVDDVFMTHQGQANQQSCGYGREPVSDRLRYWYCDIECVAKLKYDMGDVGGESDGIGYIHEGFETVEMPMYVRRRAEDAVLA